MTDEIKNQPEETRATGEINENSGRQALEDTTLEPRVSIEQNGDIHQAEQVQQDLSNLVEKTWITPEGEEGHPPEPPDLNHNPYPEEILADTGPRTLMDDLPKVRGDLDRLITNPEDTVSGDDATPIPLPGPDGIEATPIPLPARRIQPDNEESSSESNDSPFPEESLADHMPEVHNLDQATRKTGESGGEQATPINLPGPEEIASTRTPETPRQEAEFEKPILNQELEDLDSGLDNLDSLIPGESSIEGAWEGKTPNGDILDGLPGFGEGPGNIKNDLGPHDEMPPGGFKTGQETMDGGGRNLFWKYNNVPGEQQYQRAWEMTESDENYEKDHEMKFDPLWAPEKPAKPGKSPDGGFTKPTGSDYKSVEKDREAFAKAQLEAEKQNLKNIQIQRQIEEAKKQQEAAKKKQQEAQKKQEDAEKKKNKSGNKMGEDGGEPSKIQMTKPLGAPNPKFDQDQISNYPEDHIEGSQGGGHPLSEEHADAFKRTAEKNAKVAGSKPRITTDQVTDPPEPQPGKKSESTRKAG